MWVLSDVFVPFRLCGHCADTWSTASGWMTFAPEWFTGSPNLDTSNWMYL